MNKSESIKNISLALLKSQSEMGNAVKGTVNPFFKSKFSDLNAIREASLPVLNKNGITVLQPTTVVDGKNYVETTLLHESGEFLSSLTEVVTSKINDPQAHGSGLSYSRRYGLQSFLCIGAEDDDSEKAMDRHKHTTVKPTVVETKVTTTVPIPTTERPSFRRPAKVQQGSMASGSTNVESGDDL
jgi:hypothetical protein